MNAFHPLDRDIALQVRAVSFSYGPVRVFESLSFHIHRGEFIALAGPNGSGKTTLIKLVMGLEKAQGGRIELLGMDPQNARYCIGYVPQQPVFDRAFPVSVREVVKMGRLRGLSRRESAEDRAAVEDALEQAEIGELKNRSYAALSGGQRRRVLVARALASRPELLIMDEPTANMDRESEERLFMTLGKLKGKTTILIVTHDMEFVSSLTDRVLCLGKGDVPGGKYEIVQHPTEGSGEEGREISGEYASRRIVHSEAIPGDSCFDGSEK